MRRAPQRQREWEPASAYNPCTGEAPAPGRVLGRPRSPCGGGGRQRARAAPCAGDPLHRRRRPRHPGLAQPRARPGGQARLLGGGDRPRHSGRARGVDAEDRGARVVAEDPGDRLRRAGRRACGVGRSLDLASRRRARDGAADQHRVVDSNQRQRREHRQRSAPQGRERRRGIAARARAGTRPKREVGGRRGAEGIQPHRRGGAAAERDRRDRTDASRAVEEDRRPRDDTEALHAAHGERRDRGRASGLPHPVPLDADRSKHRLTALPRRPRRARLRALPSRRGHSRGVRGDLHGHRPVRVLGAAALVGAGWRSSCSESRCS